MTSRRRKIAGGIAALALAAGLVVAGTVAASAAPSAIAFTTTDHDITAANATIEGTVAWTTSGGAITLYIAEADGDIHPSEPCDTLLIAETTWSCVVPLEVGQNSIRAYATADDDLGFPLSTSNAIQVTVGSTEPVTISTPAPDSFTTNLNQGLTGTGPRMGSVQVQARNEANVADPFVQVCATTVDRFGAWSCATTFLDYDRYTVRAVGQTNTAIGVIGSADQNLAVVPQKPTASVISTPGLLESTSTANLPDQIVGARWTFWPNSGTPQSGLIECPTGWVSAPPPAGGSTVDCDVAAGTPGTYLLHGQGFKNDASSSDFAYLGRIPNSPVIDVVTPQSEGGVDVSGTVDPTWTDPYGGTHAPGSLGVTVVVDGFGPICTAAADLAGNWECLDTAAPGGLQDFTAYATAVGFGAGGPLDGYFAGSSPYGNTISATLIDNEVQILSPSNGSTPAYSADPLVFSGDSTLFADVDIAVEGPYPFSDTCSATPDTGGAWSCNISSFPTPPVGAYTVTASQAGSLDDVITFTRVLPTPEFNGPYYVNVGTGLTAFGGQNLYPSAGTDFWIDDGPSCTSPEGGTSGNWSCSIDLEGLAPGNYPLHMRNFDGGDPTLDSAIGSAVLTIMDPGGPGQPTINCGFSPNGGFSVSTPHVMNTNGFWLNRVYLVGGSGAPGESFGIAGACSGSSGSAFPVDDGSLYFDPIEECDPSCAASGLGPGLYEVYYTVSETDGTPGVSFEPHSYLFTIPEAPAITTAASTTLSVILRGTATPNDAVRIVRPNGTQLCTTTATGVGTWACQFPKSSTASARAIAIDPSSGGMSAYTAARSIPIAETPVEVETEPTPTLVSWFLEFGGDLSDLKPGDKFTLNVSGMPVGTEIEIWMFSEPRLLGTSTGTGAPMELDLQVPLDIESGQHEIKMIAVTPLGTNYFFTSEAMVSGGAAPADKPLDTIEDPKGDDEVGTGSGTGGGSGQRDDPAAPSGITGKVAPLQAVFDNPGAIAVAGGLALALLFLVALPTELLNSSLSSNTSRLGRVYGTIDTSMTRAQNWLIKKTRSRALVAIILVAIVAVIYGFVDPGFGFDIVSLRLVLSLAIAFFILSFVASWVSGLIIRRAWGAMAIVALQPSIILFAILGVIVARILDFSPGFLVGVAIGLELLQASKHVSARAVFVQIAVVTGFSLAAWVLYSLFTPGNDFFGMLVEDTMVATTSEGLTGALIAVFPLKFLDGRKLWEVSKRLWAAAFLIVATAFALLVLPTAISGTDVADIVTWLIVFAVFGGVSFAVWLIFVRADKKATAEKKKVDA